MGREKLVIIPTGGTIMSIETAEGIKPGLQLQRLLRKHSPYILDNFNITYVVPFPQKDSTLIDTKDWVKIAKAAYRASVEGNNVLILHGTDTISYTASALSFAIRKPQTSIVIVGSMRIPEHPETDVTKNLTDSGRFLSEDVSGIFMVFNGKVMVASRVVKINSIGIDAFETVDQKHLAVLEGNNVVYQENPSAISEGLQSGLFNRFDNKVFTFKITPELPKEVFDAILNKGFKGIVMEAYGSGDVPFTFGKKDPKQIFGFLRKAHQTAEKVPVVLASQTPYGYISLGYEVGQRIRIPPLINSVDMTSEACHVKLMWCLGQEMELADIRRAFETNYSGEITLPKAKR